MRNRYFGFFLASLCFVLMAIGLKADSSESQGPTVQVSVQSTDTSGGTLHYSWRSTDGKILDVNSPTTSWTLPRGPGIHFAYVLVSNGLGGYTERRLALNTDSIGTGSEREDDTNSLNNISGGLARDVEPRPGLNTDTRDFGREDDTNSVNKYVAPPAPAQVGDYYRSWVVSTASVKPTRNFYVPGASVVLTDVITGKTYPPSGSVTSDIGGQYTVPGVPPSSQISAACTLAGVTSDCTPVSNAMLDTATTSYVTFAPFNGPPEVLGTFTLADGSICGTQNEFFDVHVSAMATLVDASNNVLYGPVPVNKYGDFGLVSNPAQSAAIITCENAPPVRVAIGPALLSVVQPGVSPPTVNGMTATLHGNLLPTTVVKFLPPPFGLPSDIAPSEDAYLAEKGLDSQLGACKYYQAIGAVKGCGPQGELISPITYRDWQRAVKIGRFARNHVPTFHASYINKVDLNLARVHESISYGPSDTAAVVCNHIGASDFFTPTQADIDTAVLNAVNNKNLVACVAMDYLISTGVNNNQPFIRFLIFGPSGQLLPSINLDGRREKFVPGTCVVCHGGDHYGGKFPEDGSGFANVGGHFLPYDVGNFEFASTTGLRKCDQEDQIYRLNQNILNAGPTVAESELVPGWYSTTGSVSCPSTTAHVLNEDFVPPSWLASGDATAISYYRTVNARSCRTCHVAMIEGFNFDHYQNVVNPTFALPGDTFDFAVTVCGGGTDIFGSLAHRLNTMPNSLVTFNRFWLSFQNGVGLPDQATSLMNFLNDTGNPGFCQ